MEPSPPEATFFSWPTPHHGCASSVLTLDNKQAGTCALGYLLIQIRLFWITLLVCFCLSDRSARFMPSRM